MYTSILLSEHVEPGPLKRGDAFMAIVPGYEYDIFISYAHADNADPEGGDGWVSQFVKRFGTVLRQRLGSVAEELSIFFDNRVTSANTQLSELLSAVGKSALFLAVGSPSYATRDWPRRELDSFFKRPSDLSRLFVIECLPLNEGEKYPPPLDGYIRLQFWRASGSREISLPYSPVADAEEFQVLVHGLAADVRNRLLALRLLPTPEARTIPRSLEVSPALGSADNAPVSTSGASRKTLLLAQATDDVEDEIDQLRRHFDQYQDEVLLLPRACYPQGGEAFRKAFAQDLGQSGLFVQILGQRIGRTPPDLPAGYTRHQLEAAKASGIEIMQWRRPDLDAGAVSDPACAALLNAETVVACGLEAFKRQILAWVRKPVLKPRVPAASTVFINADSTDLSVAKEIERECLLHALTTILPMEGPSAEANRKDLADNLIDCDVLLFIYGETTQDWIRSQLRFFSKIKPKREMEPKLLAICSGPPDTKPDIGITLPNAHVIRCTNGWSVEPIWKLISETVAS